MSVDVRTYVEATEVTHNDYRFYSAVMPGKQLLRSCFVSRRNEDPRQGFNRSLSASRARDIARYLDRGQTIPTNVILSAQPGVRLSYSDGKLSWHAVEEGFLVLDGQHRLFSMNYTQRDYSFVVALFDGLSRIDEVQLFIDINTNQKGVPPALLLDIKQLAGAETDIESQMRRLFDDVSTDMASPLRGQLSASAAKPGFLSRVSFNTAVKRRLEAGPLTDMATPEDQSKLVINYLIACDRILTVSRAVNTKLTKATILAAFFDIFDDVVSTSLRLNKSLKPDELYTILEPTAQLDYDSYIGTNRPSKARLVADLRSAFLPTAAVTPDML